MLSDLNALDQPILGNPALTAILNLFYGTAIHDSQCGFRGISRAAYDRLSLSSAGMEFATEMIIKASFHSLRISEVPVVDRPEGRFPPPHLRPLRDGGRHLGLLLMLCPLCLYMIPATCMLCLGAWLLACTPLLTKRCLRLEDALADDLRLRIADHRLPDTLFVDIR